MNLRDELIEALKAIEIKDYHGNPILIDIDGRQLIASSVIAVLLRRASESVGGNIAEDCARKVLVVYQQLGPFSDAVEVIAEALAAPELSPIREAERKALDWIMSHEVFALEWKPGHEAFGYEQQLKDIRALAASQSKPPAQGAEGEKE